MNLFGFDISELDLANFVAAMRLVTIGVVTISFLLFFRQKRWTILAMGIAVLVVVGWLTTFYPLARIYGLQAPGDRLRNLSWVASVAAGNSPMSTGWVGDVTLEPLWALVAGGLCFGHPEFAPVVYALVSLVIPLMLGLVLFLHFRRREDEESGSELRALVVVAFALLVSSGPLDYLAPFRDFYAKNFFLKPNHTLGFVFIPLLIGASPAGGSCGSQRQRFSCHSSAGRLSFTGRFSALGSASTSFCIFSNRGRALAASSGAC